MREKVRGGRNKIVPLIIANLLVLFLLLLVVILGNKKTLLISVQGDEHLYVEWGETFTEPEVLASVKKAWGGTSGESVYLHGAGWVDTNTPGDYTLTYIAEYNGKVYEKEITITVRDTKAPVINLSGEGEVKVQPGEKYVEQGFSASDNRDGDLTEKVQITETADKITYSVTDASGNTTSVERKIIYCDTIAPVVTLLGEETVLLELNGKYEEAGAKAVDATDGDISAGIVITGTVDVTTSGEYKILYTATDAAGNKAEAVRIVRVQDTEAPVLTLSGDKKLYVKRGETYAEPGYSAVDAAEGDMTSKVEVSGSVDTTKLGIYTLTYSVKDSFGNEATETREVLVYITQSDTTSADPGKNVIYLTFDDGPGVYTQTLLDILAKYNVKATFFVTNQFPKYQYMIKKCYDAGHTIALHTYSHKYETVYSSVNGYFEDLQKIADIVKAQTGQDAKILRFPGGTSNRVSANYCEGLMTELSQRVGELGYLYCDWNVTSKDSEGLTTKADVAAATIAGIKARKGKYAVVLQHDIKKYSVEAVEEIILWGLENGYTFLPLTEDSPMWHHHVNN